MAVRKLGYPGVAGWGLFRGVGRAFEMLWNKQEDRPKKKHGPIPL